ncbi:dolichyl-phosphate-mannose--protein O-mannosyl transferase [Thermocatellispora tengchongensis]|uniref:Polyprenol-phosphate-mannose--protein mannosyltransferase n=1 Tax=Thermocatellispora tengchongensis TaxID=1073253 RepID=A0A840PDP5_9ACTN|nr:phospholipid carrier-dependent glycosyltransferase [Thermocatellispora tengchongensis]MBB5134165.1 dolichyl-phosphate-mannose--protein O-mannosyl transferase [Thermocatellispora tengchongensis]
MTDFSYQAHGQPASEQNVRVPSARERLVPPMGGSVLWGWLGPLLVAAIGAFLRFDRLDRPKAIVFDETYYAKEGLSLINFGVEKVAVKDADKLLISGNTNIWQQCAPAEIDKCASYVVHPPLGKWMIGAGEWLFGATPWGWRFVPALVGAISILILARVARRMTRSTLLGCLAGLLLALDGLHFVLSRTALLDIFLMFWVLAGFACLVVDRDRARERLVAWYESSPLSDIGPDLGWRPWRLAAGVCLGAACAVKWSGIYFLIAFAVMSLLWDAGARRAVGLRTPYVGMFQRDLPKALGAMALAPAVAYTLAWTGWFVSAEGYGRNWERATSNGPFYFVFDSARSWIDYQLQALSFHTGLESTHNYQSEPWQWPLLLRPVAFWYESPKNVCGAETCSQAVLGVGTPVIWFTAVVALIAMIAWYVATRDWRAGAVLLAYAAGWLPWFYFAIADNRTMFLFYTAPLLPFMVLAIVLAAGLVIGPQGAPQQRRIIGAVATGVLAIAALANFWYLYPVLTAETIPYQEWYSRMLLKKWI